MYSTKRNVIYKIIFVYWYTRGQQISLSVFDHQASR